MLEVLGKGLGETLLTRRVSPNLTALIANRYQSASRKREIMAFQWESSL